MGSFHNPIVFSITWVLLTRCGGVITLDKGSTEDLFDLPWSAFQLYLTGSIVKPHMKESGLQNMNESRLVVVEKGPPTLSLHHHLVHPGTPQRSFNRQAKK